MSLLSIISETSLRSGILDAAPATIIGNTDPTIVPLLALLQEEMTTLMRRHEWARMQREATFNTLAQDYQTDLATVAPDFDRFINDTEWNRAFSQPLWGPITPATWQEMKARLSSGVSYGMRIKMNPATFREAIYLLPIPSAGDPVYFEYMSKFPVLTVVAGVPTAVKQDFTADTDDVLLHEHLLKAGLRWRWKKEKGLMYAEDFNAYEYLVSLAIANDGGGAPTLAIDAACIQPHLVDYTNVPDGNWS